MTTPPSSIALVLVGSLIGSVGALFLKFGALKIGRHWTTVAYNWRLAVGVITYLLSSILFVKGMSNGELSVLFPMVSLGYILSLIWSKLFFNEMITKMKIAGMALILAGIVFVSFGSR